MHQPFAVDVDLSGSENTPSAFVQSTIVDTLGKIERYVVGRNSVASRCAYWESAVQAVASQSP
jgi:hypothetical protein